MMLWTLFITLQPPANEKLMGTAKAVEVNLEFGPRLTSGEAAAAEGLVIAAEGEAAAAEVLVAAAAVGVVVAPEPPQAANATNMAETSPIESKRECVRCMPVTSRVTATTDMGDGVKPLGSRTLPETRSDLTRSALTGRARL